MGIRLLVFSLSLLLSIPATLAAQTQAVTPSQLQDAIRDAAKTRQKNRDDVQAFFSSEPARKALKVGKIDYQRVQTAVATLRVDMADKRFKARARAGYYSIPVD